MAFFIPAQRRITRSYSDQQSKCSRARDPGTGARGDPGSEDGLHSTSIVITIPNNRMNTLAHYASSPLMLHAWRLISHVAVQTQTECPR
jgi:hypothetical protein